MAFGYDAAGNRITMSDGSGAVTYHYDQLSRMNWEERSFAGLPSAGVFRLSYEYNLGGILTKVTDQRSATSFTETRDKVGRVTAVNAIGSSGVQSEFVSQAQYRAWGGLKSRTQPGFTVNLTYNSRLLSKTYAMDGVQPVQMAYEYHNDGAIKYANDQSGQFLDVVDRAYSYDAAGRLQHAYSGLEARNFVNNTSGGTPDGPYNHAYTYDPWSNLLQDSGRIWSRTVNTADNYNSNNRVPTWSYDAEGNVLSRNEVATTISPFVPARYTYDAAGRQVGSTQTRTYTLEYGNETSVFVNSQSLDGDNQMTHYGLVVNATPSNPQLPPGSTTTEAYLLRSTVLGGSVISEYKADGTWSKTHVYVGGERLGQQTTAPSGTPQSILENLDPITGDGIKHLSNGSYFGMTTLDAGGVDVGVSDPFPPDGSGAEDGGLGELTKTVPFITPIEGGGAKCILDGLEIECSRISGNSSVQCPNNDCNATVTLVGRSRGEVVATWVQPAPEGWDPAYDGTYRFNDGLPWRRIGGDPQRHVNTGRRVSNHAVRSAAQQSNPSRSDDLTPEQEAQFTKCLSEMYKVYNDGHNYRRDGEAWFHGHSDSRRHWWNSSIGDFTVRTDQSSKSATELSYMNDPVGMGKGDGQVAAGYTDKRNPYFNFIAYDARILGVSGREYMGLWIYELGNALAVISNRFPDTPADARDRYGVAGEPGSAFEDCVFGGRLNADGSITRPKQ